MNKFAKAKLTPGDDKIKSLRIYGADGTEYPVNGQWAAYSIAVTPKSLRQIQRPGEAIEIIRDPHDPNRGIFLRWADGAGAIHPKLERNGAILVPPTFSLNPSLVPFLPSGLRECGTPAELVVKLIDVLPKYLDLTRDQALLAATFGLASWFPDCFEVVPYLWVTGPLGSGKTKALRFLKCICRRAVLVGDVRSAAIYQLVDTWAPTLLLDELDQAASGRNNELLRLLRTGTQPDTPAVRNGVAYEVFGFKAISSTQSPVDGAFASRCLIISMLPTDRETMPLDNATMEAIAREYQDKLLMIRFKYFGQIKNFKISPDRLAGLSPRMKQIAPALFAPLLGAEPLTYELLKILTEYDAQGRVERTLEPEWLTVEALMRLCHEKMLSPDITVGTVAAEINSFLKDRGEDIVYTARKIGDVIKSLGVRKEKLGNRGIGIRLDSNIKRDVHKLARRFEIDRLVLCSPDAPKWGWGGEACALCHQFGLEAGLRYLPDAKPVSRYWQKIRYGEKIQARKGRPVVVRPRTPIFDKREWDALVGEDDSPPNESSAKPSDGVPPP